MSSICYCSLENYSTCVQHMCTGNTFKNTQSDEINFCIKDLPIFHTHVSTAMDVSGNQLMLPCYLFVHKCNGKKIYDQLCQCVEASCKIVVFTEWRIYIKSRASTSISLFLSVVLENIENWLGGYKRWLCSVLNCKKCARMNCWQPPNKF